jgi:hypothetical protein
VYSADGGARLRFHPLPPPTDQEVAALAALIAKRLARLLERRGLHPDGDPDEVDPLAGSQPWLAALASASVRGVAADGPRAGQRALRFGDEIDPAEEGPGRPRRCASASGVSLHADVCLPGRDRRRLEKLCRYVARPPLALERLSALADGRLSYRLRRRWRDGTTHMVFEPLELLERLAALVPPPRVNMVRYHGILAPAARDRQAIVLREAEEGAAAAQSPGPHEETTGEATQPGSAAPAKPTPENGHGVLARRPGPPPATDGGRRWIPWAELMRRVFEIDVLECPQCGGRLRILSAIHPPETTAAILECLGLPARPPPLGPAEAEPWDLETDPVELA